MPAMIESRACLTGNTGKEPGTERRVIIPKEPKTGKPTTKPDPGPKHVPPTKDPKKGK